MNAVRHRRQSDTAALQQELRRRGVDDGPTVMTLRGPISASPWSRVFYADGDCYRHPVAVKQFLDAGSGIAADRAISYYAALQRLAGAALSCCCSAARPVALYADIGVVLTEWVAGRRLSQCLLGASLRDARAAARQSGIWLGGLHDVLGIGERPLDTPGMLAQLDTWLVDGFPSATRPLAEKAADLLRHTASALQSHPIPWTCEHGDFKPDNLIRAPHGLVGIDFLLQHESACINDVAHFLNHLWLLCLTPRGLLRLPHRKSLIAAFIAGYQSRAGIASGTAVLAWARLYDAVRLAAMHRDWAGTAGIRRRVASWCIDRLIAANLTALEAEQSPASGSDR